MKPVLILVNPWIYDFAAYDLWSKPLGLLYLAAFLRRCGFEIHLIDCLNVHHPHMKIDSAVTLPVRRLYGTGKFWRQKAPRPLPLKDITRPYSRYGVSRQLFIKDLEGIEKPTAILVTSLMTYWYPGVQEVISLARRTHPDVPVILGGIYARLCTSHAIKTSGADRVVGFGDLTQPDTILGILADRDIPVPDCPPPEEGWPYPAFDMLDRIDYVCLLTSTGCPYRCQYCASHFLYPRFSRRDPLHVLEEILYWRKARGVRDFAFYDDALLVDSDLHMAILLENLIRLKLDVRFHTPNALHVREITSEIARLLYLSGFRTIRLGLETSDMQMHREMDRKIAEGEFEEAVQRLKKAGYLAKEIGVYLLMGLPGQSAESVKDAIKHVGRIGATPYLAEYSPVPHTPLWEKAESSSSYDLSSEPLFHNNTLLPCWDQGQRGRVPELKRLALETRQGLR